MKGIVFREFLDMVEERFGLEISDEIVEETDPSSGGAYTSVGTYDHNELIDMVVKLSEKTGTPAPDLVMAFGHHLFGQLASAYPQFIAACTDMFDFLDSIEKTVHVQVRKLYPDAELPYFDCTIESDNRMHMYYRSSRPFADLAEGLIAGAAEYYGEQVTISRDDRSTGDETRVWFTIQRRSDQAA